MVANVVKQCQMILRGDQHVFVQALKVARLLDRAGVLEGERERLNDCVFDGRGWGDRCRV